MNESILTEVIHYSSGQCDCGLLERLFKDNSDIICDYFVQRPDFTEIKKVNLSMRKKIYDFFLSNYDPKYSPFLSRLLVDLCMNKCETRVKKILKAAIEEKIQLDLETRDKKRSYSAFHHACVWGNQEVLDLFVQLAKMGKFDINQTFLWENSNSTGLYLACWKGGLGVVKKLYKCGIVDFNHKDKRNGTFWYSAIDSGNRKVLDFLHQHYPLDPNHKTEFGFSLIERAIYSGKMATFDFLIEFPNLDTNCIFENKTPLMLALDQKQLEMANKILEHPNTNIYIKNSKGETVLDFVKDKEVWDLVPVILKKLNSGTPPSNFAFSLESELDRLLQKCVEQKIPELLGIVILEMAIPIDRLINSYLNNKNGKDVSVDTVSWEKISKNGKTTDTDTDTVVQRSLDKFLSG